MSREVCPLSANMAKRVIRLYYWNIKAHSPLLTGGQTKIIFFGAAAFFKVSSFVIFLISISSKQLVLFDWGKKKACFFPGTEVCISVQKQKVAGGMRCCCFSCGSKNSCKFSKKTCHKPILQLAVFATELLQTSPMFFCLENLSRYMQNVA